MVRPEDFTVGVEEEYQLVDGASGALRARARFVIAGDWAREIKPEMQQHTVEVETRVCEGTNCVRDDLARLRFQAAVAAEAESSRVVAAGTHPFSPSHGYGFSEGEVYRALREEYRALAESQAIFGMHVHVGVPGGVDRTAVMNVARLYLPHLLALTASSPFHEGRDTGYASYRAILWRRWPRSGPPPRLRDEDELAALVRWLTETGCVDSPGRIYWDVRPHHRYPTLEFRVMDVTPRLDDAVAAAALARAVVAGVVEGVLSEPELPPPVVHALLGENGWRAARYGMEADFVDLAGGRPRTVPAREAIPEVARRVAPLARALGDDDLVEQVEAALARGGAAAALRARAAEAGGDLGRVALWAADETVLGAGMDRRRRQRIEAIV